MRIIVQKFGGGVISDISAIEKVADIISKRISKNTTVAVVVSAMGNTTDELLKLAKKVNPLLPGRETDMLLTSGERITISLLALALINKGYDAVSFTGSQVGIITDEHHTDARIVEIRGARLKQALKNGKIPIVAGFQGVSYNREITTLGRGGSDVTAVALAAYLNAEQCELYKDVSGLFTENPKIFPKSKHIPFISYDEMAELTNAGSEIIHTRACALASKYNIDLIIKCFTRKDCMTTVTGKRKLLRKNQQTEKAFVRAITHSGNLYRLSLVAVPKLSKCLHQVIVRLAEAKIPLLFFAHGVPYQNKFDLSFIVSADNYKKAKSVLEKTATIINAEKLEIAKNLASISLVGPGISNDIEIFSMLFQTLHKLGIHIDAFTSSEMKITCFLRQENVIKAINALLKEFKLIT